MPVEFWCWVDFGRVENVLGGKWHGWISAGWKTAVTLGGKRRGEKGWVDFGRVDFVYHRFRGIELFELQSKHDVRTPNYINQEVENKSGKKAMFDVSKRWSRKN